MKKNTRVLILILIIATFLRLWKIDQVPVSLFGDELDVGYHALSILKTGKDYSGNPWPLYFESSADRRTPLYIYTSVPTVAVFGITPWGVRLPAALYGILGIWAMYLLVKEIFNSEKIAMLASATLTISPWHIQYSRAAFEVTMLLAFLIFGLYFFFKALKDGKLLWLSIAFLVLTPLIYSTAKLFVPLLLIFLFFVWKKKFLGLSKRYLIWAVAIGVILGAPSIYGTFISDATQRFSYISIFTDPTVPGEVEFAKLTDARVEGGNRTIFSKIESRLVHNKYTFWAGEIVENYFNTFSSEFLFIKGDINLRHSIEGVGQLYKVEAFALILGAISFFGFLKDKKIKSLILFWILVGTLPSAITRDGAGHATRLILILPPLAILISYGISEGFRHFGKSWVKPTAVCYMGILVLNFWSYQHNYWVENPWYSERSWHAGYKEVVETVRAKEKEYKKIVITNANDDPRIFFASYYLLNPTDWQKGLEQEPVEGFGNLQHFGKFYFGQVDGKIGLSALADYLDDETLYIASSREINGNLAMEPQKVPKGLRLIKPIFYPSGEPAFYLFSGEN